jgi:hypothetical protein
MSIVSRFTGDAKMATISDIAQAGAYFIYRLLFYPNRKQPTHK